MKKETKHYKSMFGHLTITFIIIGLLPLVIVSGIFFKRYSDNMESVLISNASQLSYYVSKNVDDTLNKIDGITRYLYEYSSDEYAYFYQIIKDENLPSNRRSDIIKNILKTMLYMDKNIEGVRFIDENNKLYTVNRNPSKNVYGKVMLSEQIENKNTTDYKKLQILPTFPENKFYHPSKDFMFTVARNYMDTTTVLSANNNIIGTVYLDINISIIFDLVKDVQVGDNSNIYIINKNTGDVLYSENEEDYGTVFEDFSEYTKGAKGGYVKRDDVYLVYENIGNSDWVVVTKILKKDIYMVYRANQTYFFIVLFSASIFLILIYVIYSRNISKPVLNLKNMMREIENGNLNVHIESTSTDEIGYLADGLNHMVDNLQRYINKVYIAEIRQREAELDALKTQISPHYLYNTLDVIRMTAITNDDSKTAEMLGSLSSQLQYMIGHNSDTVPLRRELENIKEYFVIVRIRYEEHFDLDINVNKEDLELPVMKLVLQPVVENAVKHGFKNKRETGRISITAIRRTDYLEISVMDDGVGITEEKLAEINQVLESEEIGHKTEDGWSGVGVKNVYDRIKKNYGEQYGFEITSCENLGTIVKFKLPILDMMERI